jgi:ACS family hexuronate transporter-like MFS transporter
MARMSRIFGKSTTSRLLGREPHLYFPKNYGGLPTPLQSRRRRFRFRLEALIGLTVRTLSVQDTLRHFLEPSQMAIAKPAMPVPGDRAASHFRWFILALLFLATTINYVDRQILALLKPILDQELGWTNEQYGYVNSAFQATYAFSYVAFGWFIDKYGIKIGYTVSIVMWSVAAACHGLVGSARGFLFARLALGLGEGGSFPACIKAIAYWFPQRERALAASLFNSGANVGPMIAPMVVPWIAYTYGWRMAFVAAGIVGLLWLVLWLPFYSAPEKSSFVSDAELAHIGSDKDAKSDSSGEVNWWRLFTFRQTWAYLLTKFLTDPISWFWLIWLPDIFKKTRGLDIKASWIHLVAIYTISMLFSIIGGWFTGHLIKRGWPVTRARKTGMAVFALCVVPVVFALKANVWVAVCLIGVALAAHHAWATCLYAVNSDVFPKRAVAAVAGIGGMAGSVGGILFPAFAGWLLDHYKTTPGGEKGGYAILFGICSSAYIVAFAVNHLLAPRYEQVDLDAGQAKVHSTKP